MNALTEIDILEVDMKRKIANAMLWYANFLRQDHKLAYLLTVWAKMIYKESITNIVAGRYDR
jgi:hypothetical protein